MTEPIYEDEGTLQEWAPETRLLQQIPLKVQKGIFSRNLNLTCVDAVSEYIALGTNCGLIYWYCRVTDELQRLRFEESDNTVTCVKIVSSVDYMVAGGTNRGNITIFQIPKEKESAQSSTKPKKNQIERFTINGLHNGAVTNIEWSQNGMKLFSGDKNGLVVLTEIDFYMHLSKSVELLNEQFEIVQLSYCQQILLISTYYRSIICDGLNKWKVHQVGTKERKILGKFGATFSRTDNSQELVIYASRPGHRLWLANSNGSVQQTLLFKSAVYSSHPRIQLINPVSRIESCESQFGKLLPFGSDKIIAYNSEMMYVLHPTAVAVTCSLNAARKIIDLAVGEGEIFVLEGERSLLRIGYTPNKYQTEDLGLERASRRSFIFDEIASKLKDTAFESFKKITSELVILPDHTSSPNSPPALADEALNLPPIVNLPPGSISTIVPEEKVEIHFSVDADPGQSFKPGGQNNEENSESQTSQNLGKGKECDEIISRPLRRRTPKRTKITASPLYQGQESESDTTSNASEDRLVWGVANDFSLSEDSKISCSQSQSSFSILKDIPGIVSANLIKSECGSLRDVDSRIVDDKSQTSLDTCESVSEHLKLTPDRFSEEQEKTFFRLANQEISLLDSYNSEKTDNMSISLNLTPSSSFSSKLSDNVPSNSEISENVSMVSETKTENSHSSTSTQNDSLPLPKTLCFCNTLSDANEDGSNQDLNSSTSNTDEQIPNVRPSGLACPELSSTDEKILKTNTLHTFDVENLVNEDVCEGDEDRHSENLNEERHGNVGDCGSQDANVEEQSLEPISCLRTPSCTFDSSPSLDSECLDVASKTAVNIDQSDHWLQYIAPGAVVCLAAARGYVVCVDNKGHVTFSGLSELSLSWNSLTYKASWISLSNNATIVWILNNTSLFTLVNPAQKGPYADDMLELNTNVRHVAIDNENPEGWIVKMDGKILRQRNLVAAPCGNPEQVPCDWLLTNVACWNGVAMAITCEGSVVCKTPNEERFRSIVTPKPTISYVELGPQNLVWVIDDRNNIYFSDDFLREEPHWWQILISDYIFQNSTSILQSIQKKIKLTNIGEHFNVNSAKYMIASNENSVWIFDKCSNILRVNKTAITGKPR
ncbi:UNVERIFIED_CONTAM: hypothetical protein PYX00_006111 [Menopon gallinae]|uniref:HPS5-like beta-propeller domain-containing protein n=1 Tax=Menopon gallinae TaxID=328185 RepID=A0AAW2HVU5_9NEOP